jgi:hypothetical protein
LGLDRKEESDTLIQSVLAEERKRLQAEGADAKDADWKEKSMNEQLEKLKKLLP